MKKLTILGIPVVVALYGTIVIAAAWLADLIEDGQDLFEQFAASLGLKEH